MKGKSMKQWFTWIVLTVVTFAGVLPATAQQDCSELVVAEYRRPMLVCPSRIDMPPEMRIGALIFESVYRLDEEQNFQAVLGRIESVADDGQSCLLSIRSDSQWVDFSSVITLDDVLFSLACHINASESRRAGTLSLIDVDREGSRLRLRFSSSQNEEGIKSILSKIPIVPIDEYDARCDYYSVDRSVCENPTGSGWYFLVQGGVTPVRSGDASSLYLNRAPGLAQPGAAAAAGSR